jgi:hypothetical protein
MKMKSWVLVLCAAVVTYSLGYGIAGADDIPSGKDVTREAMAKAQADKAKNDRVVDKQRAAEKAAKEKASPTPPPTKDKPKEQ